MKPQALLTEDDVRLIRESDPEEHTIEWWADELGVCVATISRAASGKTWKNHPTPPRSRGARHVDSEEIAGFCAAYSGGESITSIAKRCGRHRETVVVALERHAGHVRGSQLVGGRGPKRTEFDRERAMTLYSTGLTLKETAAEVGVSATLVQRLVRAAGKSRSQGFRRPK